MELAQQLHQRGLAGAVLAHHGDHAARRQAHRDVVHGVAVRALVPVPQVPQVDAVVQPRGRGQVTAGLRMFLGHVGHQPQVMRGEPAGLGGLGGAEHRLLHRVAQVRGHHDGQHDVTGAAVPVGRLGQHERERSGEAEREHRPAAGPPQGTRQLGPVPVVVRVAPGTFLPPYQFGPGAGDPDLLARGGLRGVPEQLPLDADVLGRVGVGANHGPPSARVEPQRHRGEDE